MRVESRQAKAGAFCGNPLSTPRGGTIKSGAEGVRTAARSNCFCRRRLQPAVVGLGLRRNTKGKTRYGTVAVPYRDGLVLFSVSCRGGPMCPPGI